MGDMSPAADDEWHEATGLDPFTTLLGPLLVRRDGEPGQFALRTDERHRNPNGIVHGGMLMTLADKSMGVCASETLEHRMATAQISHQFHRPVQVGELIECWPRILRIASTLVFVETVLVVASNVVCAASGVYSHRGGHSHPSIRAG